MTTLADDSAKKLRALRRMKALAVGALLLSLVLLLVAHRMGRQGAWGWVGAFAEAATVGALADWFAVTALFRHPLGLPIPHTAIIPRNQVRIADSLAAFVRDKFLDKAALLQRMAAYNLAQKLGDYLAEPATLRRLTGQAQEWAAKSVTALDNPALAHELLGFVQRQLRAWNAAPTAAQLVQVLTHGSHHQRVLNAALEKVAQWVGHPDIRELIANKMVSTARREYPKTVWVTDKLDKTEGIADALALQLAQALIDEVQNVLSNPTHPLRQHYAAEVGQWMQRLEHDPDVQQQVQAFKDQLLDHPALQGYVQQIWQQLRDWLHADLQKPDSTLAAHFMDYASAFGQRLQRDPAWQNAVNAQLQVIAWHLADHLRTLAPEHIRKTMQSWEADYMVGEIEKHVGTDLQFIRLNGTVIGGLAGVVLYGVLQWWK